MQSRIGFDLVSWLEFERVVQILTRSSVRIAIIMVSSGWTDADNQSDVHV